MIKHLGSLIAAALLVSAGPASAEKGAAADRKASVLPGPPVEPDRTWKPDELVDGTAKDANENAARPEEPDKTWKVETKDAKPGQAKPQIKPTSSDRTWLPAKPAEGAAGPAVTPEKPDKTWKVETNNAKAGPAKPAIEPAPADREWKTGTKPPAAKAKRAVKKKRLAQ